MQNWDQNRIDRYQNNYRSTAQQDVMKGFWTAVLMVVVFTVLMLASQPSKADYADCLKVQSQGMCEYYLR